MIEHQERRVVTDANPDTRLGELVLYLADRCEDDPAFGAVKLNKLLWKIDFAAYVEFGESITGQDYFALDQGPAPRRLLPVLDQLQQSQSAAVRPGVYYGRTQQRVVALREANLEFFSGPQIALVERFIKECWSQNATELSKESHNFMGWKVARKEEIIPFEVALIQDRPLTKTEEQFAQALAQRLFGE